MTTHNKIKCQVLLQTAEAACTEIPMMSRKTWNAVTTFATASRSLFLGPQANGDTVQANGHSFFSSSLMIFGYYTASHFFREIEPGFLRQRRRQEISFKGEKQFRFSYPVFWRTKNKKSLSQASPLSQAVFATKPARKSPTSQGQKTNRERALPPHCTRDGV